MNPKKRNYCFQLSKLCKFVKNTIAFQKVTHFSIFSIIIYWPHVIDNSTNTNQILINLGTLTIPHCTEVGPKHSLASHPCDTLEKLDKNMSLGFSNYYH